MTKRLWPPQAIGLTLRPLPSEHRTFNELLCQVRRETDRQPGQDWNMYLEDTRNMAELIWERISPSDTNDTDELIVEQPT